MAPTNKIFNRRFIDHFGKELTKEFLKKNPQPWRVSRGGLNSTIVYIESRELHGKISAQEAADKLDCCKNTVYDAQKNKENSDVPQNELSSCRYEIRIFSY